MKENRDEARCFWAGPRLSPYEELSLQSFVAAGARVLLYSPDPALRVPDGVELVDLRELLPEPLHHFRYADGDASVSLHSDLFRYEAVHRHGGWYFDLDMVAVGGALPDRKVYLARENDTLVNAAVMKFPAQSPVMAAAIEEARRLLPQVRQLEIGPDLITRLARECSLDHLLRPPSCAYPIAPTEVLALFDPRTRDELDARTADSDFVHLWSEIWRRVRIPKNYGPPDGSFLDGLFRRFGFGFTPEARLPLEALHTWARERHVLLQIKSRLNVDVVPEDAVARLTQPLLSTPAAAARNAMPQAATPQTMRTFWQGEALGPWQLLALHSFVDRGHRVEVFSYGDSLRLPEWLARGNAAAVIAPDRVLRPIPGQGTLAIHANLFRYALLHRFGGWWVDPDVVLLTADLPPGETFVTGPTEFGVVSPAAIKLPPGHPLMTEALLRTGGFEPQIENWERSGAPLLADAVDAKGLGGLLQPAVLACPVSWFDVPSLFDPAQCEAVARACEGRPFLDLHTDVWLRAGVPSQLGPPRGSFLETLMRRHISDAAFPAAMEFADVRRWIGHLYECDRLRAGAMEKDTFTQG